MTYREKHFFGRSSAGPHKVAYLEWGDPDNPQVVMCVHGLTRNNRDFDYLAAALEADFRVICPNIVGRGNSGRLENPLGYAYPQYIQDLTGFIGKLGVGQVYWVGTSMGGAIGMGIAASDNSPIAKLVLNDIGPFVGRNALARVRQSIGAAGTFSDIEAAEAYFRRAYAATGALTAEQWRHLAEHGTQKLVDGHLALAYDPQLSAPYLGVEVKDVDLWAWWRRIACPVLLLHGTASEILVPETVREMLRQGPPTRLAEFPGIGHAPMLMEAAQIDPIVEFFRD
ncbi:MAG: alpha/beta fold hydrolase [Betaproteobacteria bacterium]